MNTQNQTKSADDELKKVRRVEAIKTTATAIAGIALIAFSVYAGRKTGTMIGRL